MAGSTKLPPVPNPPHGNIILSVDRSPQQRFIWGTVGFVAIGAGKNFVMISSIRIGGYSVTIATVTHRPPLFFPVFVSKGTCSPINLCKVTTVFGAVNIITGMAPGSTELHNIWQIAAVVSPIVCGLIFVRVVGIIIVVRSLVLGRVIQHPFAKTGRGFVLISPEVRGRVRIVERPSDCRLDPSQSTQGDRVILLGGMVIVADETWVGVTGKPIVSAHGVI
jgi:hypothetical protein